VNHASLVQLIIFEEDFKALNCQLTRPIDVSEERQGLLRLDYVCLRDFVDNRSSFHWDPSETATLHPLVFYYAIRKFRF
jgi:hypothetical protein